jgi:hypothetical protein
MLYLLQADGIISTLEAGEEASREDGFLVCRDAHGNEIVRYPHLTITVFSKVPFPKDYSGNGHGLTEPE